MPIDLPPRWFEVRDAFDHPVTIAVTALAAGLLLLVPLVVPLLRILGVSASVVEDVRVRHRTWAFLAPLILGPILLGAGWVILALALLGLVCFGEYARATGLFRERWLCAVVALAILQVALAVADHWYEFFVATTPITICVIAVTATVGDRPSGYIQRVGLALLGFLLFGTCLGHISYLANLVDYRPTLLWFVVCVELSDIFAYCTGKLIGGPKLLPNTSPGKTVSGAVGSLVLTTGLSMAIGCFVFDGTPVAAPFHLAVVGFLIGLFGQLGDLMLSSLKRDLGIKDLGMSLPGHGGFLDRFDSLLLAAPATFVYIGAWNGWRFVEERSILLGGGG